MENKIKIAERRYAEMEIRKVEFMRQYAETGSELSLELAYYESEAMDKLALAIMEAKKNEKEEQAC